MLDDLNGQSSKLAEVHFQSEIFTIARSVILGLAIAAVAIGLGPTYGAATAGIAVAAVLMSDWRQKQITERLPVVNDR